MIQKFVTAYSKQLTVLERVQRKHAARLFREFQLQCKTGEWLDCAVLKLQKPDWSDHGMEQGIFFSVWVGEHDIAKGRFNYNLHALKLGAQKCCGVKPVAFAKAFRRRFKSTGWLNVSTDYGPQTLMQGWLPLDPRTFEQDVLGLIDGFAVMHHVIDELLEHEAVTRPQSPDKAQCPHVRCARATGQT